MATLALGAEGDGGSMLRLFADMQALIQAQRRIEWKLTGLMKGQTTVTSTLDELRQDLQQIRGHLNIPQPKRAAVAPPSGGVPRQILTGSKLHSSLPLGSLPNTRPDAASNTAPPRFQELPETSGRGDIHPRTTSGGSGGSGGPRTRLAELEEEVLLLRRQDGRLLTQLGRWKKKWTGVKTEAECRLPGLPVEGNEPRGDALRRLLASRLHAISQGVRYTGETSEEEVERGASGMFGRGNTRLREIRYLADLDPNFQIPAQCLLQIQPNARRGGAQSWPNEDVIGIWHDGAVYLFSWLSPEECAHYASKQGDTALTTWMGSLMVDEEALQKMISL